jgi:hypothetical protein
MRAMARQVPAANSALREAGMVATCESEMPAGVSAKVPTAAARERERRNEDGTGKRCRHGGTPKVTAHGLISPCAQRWSRRDDFGSNGARGR